jgi:hypothetical protein
LVGPNILGNQSAEVDEETLGWLEVTWDEYHESYNDHEEPPYGPIIDIVNGVGAPEEKVSDWKQATVDIWEHGYPSDEPHAWVPPSYTSNHHNRVLALAGVESPEGMTRQGLLESWALQEAKYHWGDGDPETPFRMYEGGADEQGSLSFSQLLFHYRYSETGCSVHREMGLNLFDPQENLMSFALHTAASRESPRPCNGSFWRGFSKGQDQLRHDREGGADATLY